MSHYFLCSQNKDSIILGFFQWIAAKNFPKELGAKSARIPPQTPPAGGKSAEAGRIHIPPVNCFALPSPFRFLPRDFPQNTFELCLANTAII